MRVYCITGSTAQHVCEKLSSYLGVELLDLLPVPCFGAVSLFCYLESRLFFFQETGKHLTPDNITLFRTLDLGFHLSLVKRRHIESYLWWQLQIWFLRMSIEASGKCIVISYVILQPQMFPLLDRTTMIIYNITRQFPCYVLLLLSRLVHLIFRLHDPSTRNGLLCLTTFCRSSSQTTSSLRACGL